MEKKFIFCVLKITEFDGCTTAHSLRAFSDRDMANENIKKEFKEELEKINSCSAFTLEKYDTYEAIGEYSIKYKEHLTYSTIKRSITWERKTCIIDEE